MKIYKGLKLRFRNWTEGGWFEVVRVENNWITIKNLKTNKVYSNCYAVGTLEKKDLIIKNSIINPNFSAYNSKDKLIRKLVEIDKEYRI